MPSGIAEAQTLDLAVDARLGTGTLTSSGETSTTTARAPTNIQFDMGFMFDGDRELEFVLGTIIQLEKRVVLALDPKIKVMREVGTSELYAFAGLPWYVAPVRRLGVELGGGLYIPVNDAFGWVTNLSIQGFFAGADIPDGQAVLAINGAFGVRLAL